MVNYQNLGYKFEKDWERSLKNMGFEWVYKLPDARAMKGFNMPYVTRFEGVVFGY